MLSNEFLKFTFLGPSGIVITQRSADVQRGLLVACVSKPILDSGQMVVVCGLLSAWDVAPGQWEVHCTQTVKGC